MQRYAFAVVTFHENELIMGTVAAATKEEAMVYALSVIDCEYTGEILECDFIQEWAFDCDILVNAIEI